MKKVCRLLRDLVALEPLRRCRSDGGLLYDMSRMDDKRQWRVLNVSYQVWKAGDIKVGDHVITQGVVEPEHEFTDGVIFCKAGWIVAVAHTEHGSGPEAASSDGSGIGPEALSAPVEDCPIDGTPSPVPAQN